MAGGQSKGQKQRLQEQTSQPHSGTSDELFAQMESLRKDLLALSQRAEYEIESGLKRNPAPVSEALREFSLRVGAQAGAFWLESACLNSFPIDGLPAVQLNETDLMQCGLALSGREMAFDFLHGRIFFPVVVFENPIAVAVFEISAMNCSNYENICAAACDGIRSLRQKLRIQRVDAREGYNAAS